MENKLDECYNKFDQRFLRIFGSNQIFENIP